MIEFEWQAMSAEEICQQHPGLTLAQVYSALGFFYEHRDEILQEIEADRAAVEHFRGRSPDQVRSASC